MNVGEKVRWVLYAVLGGGAVMTVVALFLLVFGFVTGQ